MNHQLVAAAAPYLCCCSFRALRERDELLDSRALSRGIALAPSNQRESVGIAHAADAEGREGGDGVPCGGNLLERGGVSEQWGRENNQGG